MYTQQENRKKLLQELMEKLGYDFQNVQLISQALTHSSYANENRKRKVEYNERLEFLGDSVLSIVISDYLYNHLMDHQEGELTKIRASIVCESSLARCSMQMHIGKYLLLGKGEEVTGGRERVSILADTFEAIIGAVYLDGGLEKVRAFILNSLSETIRDGIEGKIFKDYKTHLQEVVQSSDAQKIVYEVIKEEGPDHNKMFYIQVLIGDKVGGEGKGKSKKEAEQNAAKEALKKVID